MYQLTYKECGPWWRPTSISKRFTSVGTLQMTTTWNSLMHMSRSSSTIEKGNRHTLDSLTEIKGVDNTTSNEKEKAGEEIKEEYLEYLMLGGEHSSHFENINAGLEKMTCGSDSYPRTKDRTVGLLNNYHVSKQPMRTVAVKEDAKSRKIIRETKENRYTKKKSNKGKHDCFQCDNPNHWSYKYP